MGLNKSFFHDQLRMLVDNFKDMSQGRFDRLESLWFKILDERGLTDRRLARTIDALIRTGSKLPTISEVLNVSQSFLEERSTKSEICTHCESTGTLGAYIITQGRRYNYLFKCPWCSNCTADYPTWSKGYQRAGYKLRGHMPDKIPTEAVEDSPPEDVFAHWGADIKKEEIAPQRGDMIDASSLFKSMGRLEDE